jgi:hypothetical protein
MANKKAEAKEKAENKDRMFGDNVITPVVRTSFAYITKMDKAEFNGKVTETYRATGVLPLSRKDELKANKQQLLAFARTVWGDSIKWGDFKTPYKMGNDMKPEKLEKYPSFKDTIYFEMRTKNPVGVIVGKEKIKYADLSEEKQKEIAIDNAGYHAIFSFTPASYVQPVKVRERDAKGNVREVTEDQKGINFYLNSVWYVKNDERFGGERDGSDAFAGLNVEADFDDIDAAGSALDDFDDAPAKGSKDETPFDDEVAAGASDDDDLDDVV